MAWLAPRRLLPLCALALWAAAGPASAQQRDGGDKAAAEALFDHGKQLYESGRFEEACPKFAESQKLDAGVGTLLYLADCYGKIGRTASAWAGFREAAAAARSAGQAEREKTARERAADLEPSLSKLTIIVPAAAELPGIRIARNGAAVGKVLWGTPIPVDPGVHAVVVTAPGHTTWSSEVRVGERAAAVSLNVPRLARAPAAPRRDVPPPGPAQPDAGAGTGQRTLGLVLGGVGVAGCAVGAAFGFAALSKDGEAAEHCRADDPTRCDPRGVELGDQAQVAATLSTIAFGVGAAALVAGIALFVTAPASRGAATLRIAPAVGRGSGGLVLGGAF